MGRGGQKTDQASENGGRGSNVFTWEEIQKHSRRGDQWLVINRKVYNITDWVKRHPGGIRVISHYAGEDATVNFKNQSMSAPLISLQPYIFRGHWYTLVFG